MPIRLKRNEETQAPASPAKLVIWPDESTKLKPLSFGLKLNNARVKNKPIANEKIQTASWKNRVFISVNRSSCWYVLNLSAKKPPV